MDIQKYLDAVDIVCWDCKFGEETCEDCPVRKTVDHIHSMLDIDEE